MSKPEAFDDWIAKHHGPALTFPHLPDRDLPVDGLLDHLEKVQCVRETASEARRIIPIGISVPGPVGIHVFGDPHIDDPDCDIRQLRADVALVRKTEGLYALCIGDDRNNWTGRLGGLYANQSVSAANARRLVEWFIRSLTGRWLCHIGGNHDVWSGADDPLEWLARQAGTAYEPWEARLRLQFPGGEPIVLFAAHRWPGHSMWNSAHGVLRAAMMGLNDDVILGGHTHLSGRAITRNPHNGRITHCVQVASYKGRDDYARKIGARDNHVSCSASIVIDPENAAPDARITILDNAAEAAEYLTWKRARWRRRR